MRFLIVFALMLVEGRIIQLGRKLIQQAAGKHHNGQNPMIIEVFL